MQQPHISWAIKMFKMQSSWKNKLKGKFYSFFISIYFCRLSNLSFTVTGTGLKVVNGLAKRVALPLVAAAVINARCVVVGVDRWWTVTAVAWRANMDERKATCIKGEYNSPWRWLWKSSWILCHLQSHTCAGGRVFACRADSFLAPCSFLFKQALPTARAVSVAEERRHAKEWFPPTSGNKHPLTFSPGVDKVAQSFFLLVLSIF